MTIAQFPNTSIGIAVAAALLGLVVHGPAQAFLAAIFYMALTVWSYEEMTKGVNRFRRLLGLGVMTYILVELGLRLAR